MRKIRCRPVRFLTLAAIAIAASIAGEASAGMLAEGAAFPAWELPDQNSTMVRSQDLAGKSYLVWFYPKARTPGCTREAQALRDEHEKLLAAGVTVLGVSFDAPESNAEFVLAESLPFRLLSDRERTLAIAVGAASSSSAFFAKRISYLVGPDGKVRKAYADVDPATHAAEVLADAAGTADAPGEAGEAGEEGKTDAH